MIHETSWYSRTQLLVGEHNITKLKNSHVLIAGLGGVGSYAADLLCRAGIGNLTLVDSDKVSITNINRQLHALHSTVGKYKSLLMEERLHDINPYCNINAFTTYLKDEKLIDIVKREKFDYVVDAIDTLSPKTFFIYHCLQNGLKIVSSMGAGAKFDPLKVTICDISETHKCRLAYYLRKYLHKLGIKSGFKVVYSSEEVVESAIEVTEGQLNKRTIVGTISYMPALFGCMMASVVIRSLLEQSYD